MRTLNDERGRLFGPLNPPFVYAPPTHGCDAESRFFGKYGSWQVLEGVLCETDDGRIGVKSCGETQGHEWVSIQPVGEVDDRVKLIVPPREKEDATALVLQMTKLELMEAAAKADRYKKALHEIDMVAVAHGFCAVNDYQQGRKEVAARVGSIAREALDDTR